MVGANLLYRIHLRLSDVFQTSKKKVPFGGINVMLVGDLLQLKPIKMSQVFGIPESKEFLGLHNTKPLWNQMKPMILKHNHRQGEDKAWAETLNRIREGKMTEEDIEVIKSRWIPDSLLKETATHIFYENKDVISHNTVMLKSLAGKLMELKATQALPKGCKSKLTVNKGTIGDTDFQETLRFKIGARVMLTYNLDLMDDLYNGAIGKVLGVEIDKNGQVYCIVVKFEEKSVGVEHRAINYSKYPELKRKYEERNGTPIFKKELKFQLGRSSWKGAAQGKLLQFPLTTNYAQTNHKMQVINTCKNVICLYLKLNWYWSIIGNNC